MNANNRAAGRYRARRHARWRMRVIAVVLSLGGLLGFWEIVSHAPVAPAASEPSLQNAEQQLQPGNGTQSWFSPQGAPRPPDSVSGVS